MEDLGMLKNFFSSLKDVSSIFSVIYLSLEKVHEALDAYRKAHALEPNNENYKQSIKICEDRLNAAASGGASATPTGVSFSLKLFRNMNSFSRVQILHQCLVHY
jgi:hypothetical protein